MYERMPDKQVVPTIEEMTAFCGENAERFSLLNEWLTSDFNTEKKLFSRMAIIMAGGFPIKRRTSLYVMFLQKTMLSRSW